MYATTNNIELRILVRGKPITNYFHNGKNFVEGRDGSKFEIEVFNRNPFSVEAVVSVDGTSIIDGQPAGPNSIGYLIEANSSVRIPGWKVSDTLAAAFEFTGKDKSYTTEMTGSSSNNGVIGVMAFKDRNYRPAVVASPPFRGITTRAISPVGPYWHKNAISLNASSAMGSNTVPTSDALPYGDAQLSAVMNQLGTGFGEATNFKTETVKFDRGDLQAVLAVYYDNARGLKARGIEVGRKSRTRHTAVEPQAFPAMNCPIPTGWKG